MNKKCKFVIFSDLHYLPQDKKANEKRKLTKYAEVLLEELINKVNDEIKPNFVVNLGDLIEDLNNSDEDIKNYKYIYNSMQCVIFNHFGIAEDNMKDNWWFSNAPENALLANRKEIKELLNKDNKVVAVFSGHQHWTKKIKENNIDYYILGSMIEDNNGVPDGVYFIVELEKNKINVIEKHIKLNL